MAPRVFVITGTSTGFGQELVKIVLEKGDIAVATARNKDKLQFEGELSPLLCWTCRGISLRWLGRLE
jgi:NAD(P)-dependent dehydrogenase (short-subunit alcohol dehydrogenase family)